MLKSKTALNLPEPQREALRQSNLVNSRELIVFLFTFRFVSGSKTSLLSTKKRAKGVVASQPSIISYLLRSSERSIDSDETKKTTFFVRNEKKSVAKTY